MKTNSFLLAAILGFALAFTFSCSSDDGGGSPKTNTYFLSEYGILSNSVCCAMLDDDDDDDRPLSDYTFDEIFEGLEETINDCSGLRLYTFANIPEDSLKTILTKAGYPPAYRNEFMSDLNRRGNNIQFIDKRNESRQYCLLIDYFEKE